MNDALGIPGDLQVWEFCHPLFRRGKPHLLASIRRKPTRQTGHEDGRFASLNEEQATPSSKAGWMHDLGPGPSRGHSQPKHIRVPRHRMYGLQDRPKEEETRQHIPSGSNRGPGGSENAGRSPPLDPLNRRSLPDPVVPLPSARSDLRQSPYRYELPQASAVEALSLRVSVLEDQVRQLADLLHSERVSHLRTSLDFTSYLSKIIEWTEARQRQSLASVSPSS